ncbi:hypothetical protein ZIOFF_018547 [Zingiber officinale]|uniref:Uncharacterized protein n=1 Tax=Zingiber officinale TaxID=94328 RepID=A0A8J5LM17_ZINOF|nr:hypothetical protein ZIOFF_018547 [Zingiber officinale]
MLEQKNSDGVESDLLITSYVAKAYIFAGLKEKSRSSIERDPRKWRPGESLRFQSSSLSHYAAALGKADDVERMWKVWDKKPYLDECLAAIEAWGRLGQIEKAEEVSEKDGQDLEFFFEGRWRKRTQYCTRLFRKGSLDLSTAQCAKRGDIHNAEQIFHRLQQMGYVSGPKQYQSLLQAYVNAKTPAYGFAVRMKADNLFPNKALVAQLMTNDAFRELLV